MYQALHNPRSAHYYRAPPNALARADKRRAWVISGRISVKTSRVESTISCPIRARALRLHREARDAARGVVLANIPADLVLHTFPQEILLQIFAHLSLVELTCFGLTCKPLYLMHWSLHGAVHLDEPPMGIATPQLHNILRPFIQAGRRSLKCMIIRSWNLCKFMGHKNRRLTRHLFMLEACWRDYKVANEGIKYKGNKSLWEKKKVKKVQKKKRKKDIQKAKWKVKKQERKD